MYRREFLGAAALAGTSLMAGTARAADAGAAAALDTPWPLRNSEAFTFESKAVGDSLAVGVWQPDEQFLKLRGLSADSLPIVYVLDGSWALPMVATIAMLQLVDLVKPGFPPVRLVGVDYPVGTANARSRDYVMEDAVPEIMAEGLNASDKTRPGGAGNFLRFMEDELDPFIRGRYGSDGGKAGILGKSFGGTFTFYAFLQQSPLFDKYWLGSPGIFTTGTDRIAEFEALLGKELVNDTRMFLTFGAAEANGGIDFYEDMGRNYNALVSALNRVSNDRLTWESRIYPGHTHTTVLAPALNDALLYLYGPHHP